MAIKWKKCKGKIEYCLFIIGLSLTVLCFAMTVGHLLKTRNMYGHIQFQSSNDYQKLDSFNELMNEKLNICLEIASGTFINWDYLERTNQTKNVSDSVAIETDFPNMSPEAIEEFLAEERNFNDNSSDYSEQTKKQMADSYLSSIKDDRNMLYRITSNGEIIYTNMDNKYIFGKSLPDGYNYVMYFDGSKIQVKKDGRDIDIDGNDINYYNDNGAIQPYPNLIVDSSLKNITVTLIAIKNPIEFRVLGGSNKYCYYGDIYTLYRDMIQVSSNWENIIITGLIGLTLLILSFILSHGNFLLKKDIIELLNKIWIEFKLLFLIIYLAFTMYCSSYFGYYFEEYQNWLSAACRNPFLFAISIMIIYFYILDIIYNRKKKQNGLILKIIRDFETNNLKLNFTKRQVRRFSILVFGTAITFILLIGCICLTLYNQKEYSIILFILATLFLVSIFAWYYKITKSQVHDLEMLDDQISNISNGNFKIERMPFRGNDFIKTEDNLLQIQSGMKNAIDDQLKSERMKVDLVANVSHDLKTPLTSIISYIQFLKDEEALPDHVKDYIRILDEKSKRLNEMVQDVFSISKATSGQLPVKMEILDFGKLLNQTLADMDETISSSNVSIKSNFTEHKYFIKADGQRMYRVCQNLIQNALKYSLEGSRMFISLEQIQEKAVATFKNTSKEELDQNIDFSARFVRGDKSRTDGGSGLGLSIAQSFTEACGGHFTININGDMFVVTIAFDQQDSPK